jgi:hypothetical protein
MKRFVATLTTMPDKYHKLQKTLETINNQTFKFDAIYLGIPKISKRLNTPYPKLPKEIEQLCTVVYCTDYGPITKLVGALLSENDPETVIISFDDDMIYPPDMVEKLVNLHYKNPSTAIGSSGMLLKYPCPMCAITPNENSFPFKISKFQIYEEGRRVDSIYGYPGALYIRKFFPTKNNLQDFLKYALIDKDMFLNDDIVISGYLSMHKIPRMIFPNMPTVSFVLDEKTGSRIQEKTEISYSLDIFFQRMNRAIFTAKSNGMYEETEDVYMTETIVFIGLAIGLSILFILILVYYKIKN